MGKAKMGKKIRRLKRRIKKLIAKCDAAQARAGQWYQEVMEADAADMLAHWPSDEEIRKRLDG